MPRTTSATASCGSHYFAIPRNCVSPNEPGLTAMHAKPTIVSDVQVKLRVHPDGDRVSLDLQHPRSGVGKPNIDRKEFIVYTPETLNETAEFAREHGIRIPCMTHYVVVDRSIRQVIHALDPHCKQLLRKAQAEGYDIDSMVTARLPKHLSTQRRIDAV